MFDPSSLQQNLATNQDNVTPVVTGKVLRLGEISTFEFSAYKGDWKTAKRFIERDPGLLTATISVHSRTVLHVAACAGKWEFMEKLVELLPEEALEKADASGLTALHYAACGGSVKACRALVRKNRALTQLISSGGWTPLLTAAFAAAKHNDVVRYLVCVTTDEPPGFPFSGRWAGELAHALALGGLHDALLHLIGKYPSLATLRTADSGATILNALAIRPSDFKSGSGLGSWQNWIYPFVPAEFINYARSSVEEIGVFEWPKILLWNSIQILVPGIKQVREAKLKHKYALELAEHVCAALSPLSDSEIHDFLLKPATITIAASYGVVEIVKLCLQMIPDLIWYPPSHLQPLLQTAVKHRQEKIFNLITYNMVVYTKVASSPTIDEFGNTILHLAAQLAHPSHLRVVSGAALQMQRELQWFKEVEKLVHPLVKETRNTFGKRAQEVFTEQHKDLLERGEQWMKDTSNSCMIVTTLIATIMFAAAFTVPGGNNGDTGIPLFLSDKLFMLFAISDALGLIFSASSLLMFLSILTARYAEEDFQKSLPKRLILGFASLFIAITSMMIAFAATFSIMFRQRSKPVATAVVCLASLPPGVYAVLQMPLFIQMYKSTYGSGIFQFKTIQ